MIETLTFRNNIGETIDFNKDVLTANPATDWILPVRVFETAADIRRTERTRGQSIGIWGTPTFLGRGTVHIEGDILYNSATRYISTRLKLLRILLHAAGPKAVTPWTNRKLGDLDVKFTGQSESFTTPQGCTIDGYPEIPLHALYPSVSPFMITFVLFEPYLIGKSSGKPFFI